MEITWMSRRIALWELLHQPTRQSDRELACAVGMSRSWVQKWRPRLREADGEDVARFQSRSRRRKTSPRQITEAVEAKILQLREQLTAQYRRRVGARNILYHLQQDPDLKRLGSFIPRSPSTIHEVLVRFGRVPRPAPRVHVPLEPAEPMQVWEIDYSDVITAKSANTEKRQHQVEVFDVIDTGSSIAIDTQVSDHCDAEWSLIALLDIFRSAGLPRVVRFDRDPRLVASWTMDGFPSAFMRCLLCLGVTPDVCPPRRPDLKPYIERFIRTQKEECIYPERPPTVEAARHLILNHRLFYNLERPNQAITCGNRPPSIALEQVPALPRLPQVVDPDAWLAHYHRHSFRRRVRSSGTVSVDTHSYYIGKRFAGQRVLLSVDAPTQQFQVWIGNQPVKVLPIHGLFYGEMPFTDYVDFMIDAARSEQKRLRQKRRLQRAG